MYDSFSPAPKNAFNVEEYNCTMYNSSDTDVSFRYTFGSFVVITLAEATARNFNINPEMQFFVNNRNYSLTGVLFYNASQKQWYSIVLSENSNWILHEDDKKTDVADLKILCDQHKEHLNGYIYELTGELSQDDITTFEKYLENHLSQRPKIPSMCF